MKENMQFKFINGRASYDTGMVFFARLYPCISNTNHLLESIFHLLWFPGYFGFNWNALYDCLCDFQWISEHKIVIVHDALPDIDNFNLKIYLEVLNDSILTWNKRKEHQLEIVFQEKDRKVITELLRNYIPSPKIQF